MVCEEGKEREKGSGGRDAACGPGMLLRIGEIELLLLRKRIRNLHLRIHPPDGRASLSVPYRMPLEAVRAFAASKLDWIRRKQTEVRGRSLAIPFSYCEGEGHYLWGDAYPLRLIENGARAQVELVAGEILLHLSPGTPKEKRGSLLDAWYRSRVREAALPLIALWEPRMGVRVDGVAVQRMKTLWGSCHVRRRRIRLNSELAKKPVDCFEYVVVHEMAHLLVRLHNDRFRALLDRFLPDWQARRQRLDTFPPRPHP